MKPIQEKRFEYKGFPCVVLFMPMGYRCGYVGLPKGNKYFGKDYGKIPIDCHCGLTYANNDLYGQDDTNTWWIGFDCGHSCDGYDIEKIKEYYADDERVQKQLLTMLNYMKTVNRESSFKSIKYVEENCMHIVEQLLEV